MAEEKTPRHKKMYANSPKLERDKESGKMGITRPEKKGKDEASSDVPAGEKLTLEMTQKQALERLELHHKHEREYAELAQKYQAAPAADGGKEGVKAPAAADDKAPATEAKKDDKE